MSCDVQKLTLIVPFLREQDGKDNRPAYTGDEQIAPSMAEMNELIHDHVIVKTLESITLKNGKSALSIYNRDDCHVHLNPSGKFSKSCNLDFILLCMYGSSLTLLTTW